MVASLFVLGCVVGVLVLVCGLLLAALWAARVFGFVLVFSSVALVLGALLGGLWGVLVVAVLLGLLFVPSPADPPAGAGGRFAGGRGRVGGRARSRFAGWSRWSSGR